jgi:hypothetical protein
MKKNILVVSLPNLLKVLVLAAGAVAIMLILGCEEQQQQQQPSAKMAKLVAAENIQLKKQLELRDKDIEKLKQLNEKELKNQEELLAKCQKEKKDLDEQLAGKFEAQMNSLIKDVAEENTKLREENENLKAPLKEKTETIQPLETQDDQI